MNALVPQLRQTKGSLLLLTDTRWLLQTTALGRERGKEIILHKTNECLLDGIRKWTQDWFWSSYRSRLNIHLFFSSSLLWLFFRLFPAFFFFFFSHTSQHTWVLLVSLLLLFFFSLRNCIFFSISKNTVFPLHIFLIQTQKSRKFQKDVITNRNRFNHHLIIMIIMIIIANHRFQAKGEQEKRRTSGTGQQRGSSEAFNLGKPVLTQLSKSNPGIERKVDTDDEGEEEEEEEEETMSESTKSSGEFESETKCTNVTHLSFLCFVSCSGFIQTDESVVKNRATLLQSSINWQTNVSTPIEVSNVLPVTCIFCPFCIPFSSSVNWRKTT